MGFILRFKDKQFEKKMKEEEKKNALPPTAIYAPENPFSSYSDYAKQHSSNNRQMWSEGKKTNDIQSREELSYAEHKEKLKREAEERKRKAYEDQQRVMRMQQGADGDYYGQKQPSNNNNYTGQYNPDDLNGSTNSYNNNNYDPDDLNGPVNTYGNNNYGAQYDPDDLNGPMHAPGPERELTEEERRQEEEDEKLRDVFGEASYTRDKTLEALKSAHQSADKSEASAKNTMGMLANQKAQLNKGNYLLNVIDIQNKQAVRNKDDLVYANKFIRGPRFKTKKRYEEQRQKEQTEFARQRDEDLTSLQESNRNAKKVLGNTGNGKSLVEGSNVKDYEWKPSDQYYFAEEGDEELEKERQIDESIDFLSQKVSGLNSHAKIMHDEIASQNRYLEKMGSRVDRAQQKIEDNTAALKSLRM